MKTWIPYLPVFCIFLIFTPSQGIHFRLELPRLAHKCFDQDVLASTLIVIQADTAEDALVGLTVSYGDSMIYSEKGKAHMKTAFTSVGHGDYRTCLTNLGPHPALIVLSIEQGPEAKDYTQVAKKEHLDAVVVSLRQIEDQLRAYHKNLLHMRSREMRMRNVNESTSSRLILFCLLNVAAVFVATILQVLYFRNFLRSKKVI